MRGVGEGSLDGIGGMREWVSEGRITLVEGRAGDDKVVVSSSRVREAVKRGDGEEVLRGLVTEGVREWIVRERLYVDD